MLSALERGERRWNVNHLVAVAAALDVEPRDLVPPLEEAPRENPPPAPLRAEEQELLAAVQAGDLFGAARALVKMEAARG